MTNHPRLIEVAFPLKQASLDSVHEKNVRHGHISTLHIWPARRPLAASRAALIATLLPDPGNAEERQQMLERLAGKVVKTVKTKKKNGKVEEAIVEETEGGILHWGRESGPDLEWFRQKIREAYGGRAPKVLDPFAGGGAIPLEAMRLGCEVTANDLNPVAWFILKCTLEYPQRLAGQKRPLPKFALESPEFMEMFFKGTSKPTKNQLATKLKAVQQGLFPPPDVDLAWHVRAWGWWVLQQARKDLAQFYPTYAEFEPLDQKFGEFDPRPPQIVPLDDDTKPNVAELNADFDQAYLHNPKNPRWIAKPTVAYLWARTVTCKNCRAMVPLLKTRWLCKKENKRVLLTMMPKPDKTGVVFGVQSDVPIVGGNAAQRREYDKGVGAGTMSRSGAICPCCVGIMTSEDMRLEAVAGRLSAMMTAVVVDGSIGKEYRLPTNEERVLSEQAEHELRELFTALPFGLPTEPVPRGGSRKGGGSPFTVHLYGLDEWHKLFTSRQLLTLGIFIKHTRNARKAIAAEGYQLEWVEAIEAELAIGVDKLADRQSVLCRWDMGYSKVNSTFTRFALPILWDYCEGNPLSASTGNYLSCIEWVAEVTDHASNTRSETSISRVLQRFSLE